MCNLTAVKDLPSQAELWEVFDYDPETGYLSNRETGHVYGSRKNKGGARAEYILAWCDGRQYLAHRVIWTMVNGQIPEDMTIDHINLDKRDNRISNLRLATSNQQQQNRRPWAKTGLKGVYVNPYGRIYSSITIGGKLTHLGYYDSIEEAAAEYEKASGKYYGQFSGPISVASAA